MMISFVRSRRKKANIGYGSVSVWATAEHIITINRAVGPLSAKLYEFPVLQQKQRSQVISALTWP